MLWWPCLTRGHVKQIPLYSMQGSFIYIHLLRQHSHCQFLSRRTLQAPIYIVPMSLSSLLLNPAKYEFGKEEIDFLGYHISASGTKPNPSKVEAICNLPSPTNCKELQQFAGMINFYHCYVPYLANIMHPLYDAMNK